MCDSAKVEAALKSALFLFLPDQERFDLFVCGAATESKAKIKSGVKGGGNVFVGATSIPRGVSNDVALLKAIFGWDLTKSTAARLGGTKSTQPAQCFKRWSRLILIFHLLKQCMRIVNLRLASRF